MNTLKTNSLPLHETPLVSSLSDASGLNLKNKVSELFGQMKELGSSHGGSLRDLRHDHQSPSPSAGSGGQPATAPVTPTSQHSLLREGPAGRGPVCTNRGFQSARAQQAAIESSVVQHSRSYNSGLNRSASVAAAEPPAPTPMAKTLSNAANLTSLCADISPCNSHFFEVLYIGKIKVSHKKVPETLIDDALTKFKQLEHDRAMAVHMRRNSLLSSQADSLSSDHGSSLDSLPGKIQQKKVDFAPLPLKHKKTPGSITLNEDISLSGSSIKEDLASPSLTPLVSSKMFFSDNQSKTSSTPNLKGANTEKKEASGSELNLKDSEEDKEPPNLKNTSQEKESQSGDKKEISVEREFDEFTAVRILSNEEVNTSDKPQLVLNKNSFPVALEPKVLILNWTNEQSLSEGYTDSIRDGSSSNGSDFVPDFDNLMNNVNKNDTKEVEPNIQNTEEPKQTVTVEKGVLKNTEVKSEKKVEEKAKKKVEFKMKDEYFDKTEVRDIERESLQERANMSLKLKANLRDQLLIKNMSDSRQNELASGSGDVTESDIDDIQDKKTLQGSMPENKQFSRDRSASIGTLNLKTPIAQLIGDQNRTMLFQVGRSDLRLISPDRKQVLLHRHLRDVSCCCQGVLSRDHLGFICREPDKQDCLVGYIFKCQSEGVASDVVGAITQAFIAHAEMVKQGREISPIFSCEHCPMVWYHKLCQDLEGMADKRIHATILRRIEQLSDEEQTQIITKYQGGTEDLYEVGEHNAFLMMLLRAHCEAKQQRHVHDTAENRSEFLNQYLGGSTIFMKAKRSLSSSFDHLLKRKATKDDLLPVQGKKESSPVAHASTPTRDSNYDLVSDPNISGKNQSAQGGKPRVLASTSNDAQQQKDVPTNPNGLMPNGRRDSVPGLNLQLQNGNAREVHESSPSPQLKSPMMDIFMKLGSTPSVKASSPLEPRMDRDASGSSSLPMGADSDHNTGSWRQAIFNRITREGIGEDYLDGDSADEGTATSGSLLPRKPPSSTNLSGQKPLRKRSREELREMWKTGINQAILLIRMEKENARLRARQEVSAVKRIKLEYEDIGGCAHENSKVWDMLTAPRESRLSTKVDSQMLLQAIRHGVPRAKRGDVWYFLAEQYCLRHPPPDTKNFPNYGTPYEILLKQLTSHQHAILIDLGRTFPSHTYFSSPLGPGQLALFNLLKAYSLLDPEVGYCQGLSFVAGVLLLHLEEAEAFLMLRHLMFRRGLRKQYLPDMVALQIQLYQLSRLVKDHIPELYDKFDQLDVSPTLYAAPWILTIFTSQFPLGFVTRVFDLVFLESSEVIFRVAIALLDTHKDGLMLCESFEEIMEYLKHKMPNIDKIMLDKVIKLAFTLDFGRQLHEYQVEYHVLQEEMAAIAPKMAQLASLEKQNSRIHQQNRQLKEQCEETMSKVFTLQTVNNKLENQAKSLEQTIALLARYIGTTHDKKRDSEMPNDIRRLCQQVQQNDRKTLGVLGQKLGQNFSSKFALTDFTNGTQNASGVSEESSSDPDEKLEKAKKHGILKTGLSTPNLFNKMGDLKKDDVQKVLKVDPNLEKKRQYLSMKKSISCNAGLMVPRETQTIKESQTIINSKPLSNLKTFPLRVLDEDPEYHEHVEKPKGVNKNLEILKSSKLSNASSIASSTSSTGKSQLSDGLESPKSKSSGFFAHSHEQIRQEKLQAEQLKRDFDENLKRLDARLSPSLSYQEKSMSSPVTHIQINSAEVAEKLRADLQKKELNLDKKEIKSNTDSGIGTPVSPNGKNLSPTEDQLKEVKANDTMKEFDLLTSHPLVGCDSDIKFDVHASKLKSIRPIKVVPVARSSCVEDSSSRN